MMRRLLLLFFSLITVMTMTAQQVSVADAMARAKTFVTKSNHPRRLPGKIATTTTVPELELVYTETRDADQKVCFYVFNYSDGTGFIIIGGDETAKEVLAYSDQGSFDYDKAPENFKWWLSQYEEQISYAMDNASLVTAEKTSAASSSRSNISPLLKTTWSQRAPYNNAINEDFAAQTGLSGAALLTGCVATTMSQIMKYHQHPTTGTGSLTGSTQSIPVNGTSYSFTPSANFGSTTYKWGSMLNEYTGTYTTTQANAVATLVYHTSVAVSMTYGTGSSSSSNSRIPEALVTYFGYDKTIRYEQRQYFTDDKWDELIYTQLANNHPVIYSGRTDSSGHSFICDGYNASDDTYHFNWGWGGSYDCYCPLTGTYAIKPGDISGNHEQYNQSQSAVINIMPDNGGLETPVLKNHDNIDVTLYDGTMQYESYSHTHGKSKTLTVKGYVWNLSMSLTMFTLGVKATDIVTGRTYYWRNSSTTSLDKTYIRNCSVNFNVNDILYNGTYTLQLVARNASSTSNDDWYDVECEPDVVLPTVVISGATDPDKTDVEFNISSDEVEVSRDVQISYSSLYDGSVDYTSSDKSIATVDADGVVTGVAPGEAKITAHASGNLYFNETTKEFEVKVNTFQKSDAEVTISANGIYLGGTATISVPDSYDGTPTYKSSDTSVATVADGTVNAVGLGDAKITVTLPETSTYNGKTVTFDVNVTYDEVYLTITPYFNNDNNPWSGDTNLYYSVRNNTTSSQKVYFLTRLYKIGSDNTETYLGGKGVSWTSNASTTKSSSYDISKYSLVEGQKYKLYFVNDADWSVPYNIPSITFTYRATSNIDLTMGTTGYATLILPFNAEIPTADNGGNIVDWKAYECNTANNNVLQLKQVTTLKRNTPYIISGSAQGTYTFTGPDAVDESPVLFGDGMLKGTMLTSGYALKAGDYTLQEKNGTVAFYKYSGSGTSYATPYEAFIQGSAGSTYNCYGFSYTDGISPIEMSNVEGLKSKAGIYSIDGVRRNSLQPGLNIVIDANGVTRKVMVK